MDGVWLLFLSLIFKSLSKVRLLSWRATVSQFAVRIAVMRDAAARLQDFCGLCGC
jgi:hypothetical protein